MRKTPAVGLSVATAPEDFDLTSAEVEADPHPALRDLRRSAGPVVWSDRHRAWLILGHGVVSDAFRDDRLSSDRTASFERVSTRAQGALDHIAEMLSGWMVFRDPPAHDRLRAPVAAAFTPRRVSGLEYSIRAATDRLLDGMADRKACDLRTELARPLPALVIAELLGVPPDDQSRFQGWSDGLAGLVFAVESRDGRADLLQLSAAAGTEMAAYLSDLLDHHRRHRADNLLSVLGDLAGPTSGLSRPEVVGAAMLLLFAGHETTTTLIANSVWSLLGRPDQLARLRADPGLWPSAVEELLRYEGPSKTMVRKVARPVRLVGQPLEPGQTVFLVIAAANRDESVFNDPDGLDVGRRPNPHLAFGWGRHHCLGAALARLETRACLSALFARFPDLAAAGRPEWAGGVIGRAVRAVPVTVQTSYGGRQRAP